MRTPLPEKSLVLFALAAVLAPGGTAARAQVADTVRIGNAVKKTVGSITALEAGDVACYVTLKDDRGQAFSELADFELCERKPSLRGKRVALTYRLEEVMADECQGDPDCKKTRKVALIVAAKMLGNATSAAQPAAAAEPGQASFCTPLETVIFSCRTGSKMVSVCASPDASQTRGYLQYRFGPPDSSDPLELMLPQGEPLPMRSATGENVPYSGGGASWLRFRNAPYAYVIYTGMGNWGPKGEKRVLEGVAVERGGKVVSVLPCSSKPATELWPDFYEKTGITTRGEEFDLPIDWPVKK